MLEADLSPACPEQIIEVVRDLFAAAPQQGVTPDVMRTRYRVFAEALSDMPAWAIREAARKWIKGEAPGNTAFAPSPGELSRLALAETLPHRALIEKLRRIQSARPLEQMTRTPETKAKIDNGFKALMANLEGKIRDDKARTAQYHDETAKRKGPSA